MAARTLGRQWRLVMCMGSRVSKGLEGVRIGRGGEDEIGVSCTYFLLDLRCSAVMPSGLFRSLKLLHEHGSNVFDYKRTYGRRLGFKSME